MAKKKTKKKVQLKIVDDSKPKDFIMQIVAGPEPGEIYALTSHGRIFLTGGKTGESWEEINLPEAIK